MISEQWGKALGISGWFTTEIMDYADFSGVIKTLITGNLLILTLLDNGSELVSLLEMKNTYVIFTRVVRVLLLLCLTQFSIAQSDDSPIIDQTPINVKKADDAIIEKVNQLIKDKQMISYEELKKQLLNPQPQPIELLPAKQKALSTEEVAAVARVANLRVGYCYLCNKCEHWHVNLAGGYAIASDVVVTCDHVVNSMQEMREGYLIIADQQGNVFPVKSVLARSKAMDAVILRVANAKFSPLPLNGTVRQGAAAYCYSSPMGEMGYFSDGIVNRFLWNRPYNGGDKNSLDIARHMRVNFSTDWAPGSSGSAVLDQSGNAIGHVSEISNQMSDDNLGQMITLHIGVPAHGVRLLAEAMKNPEEITRLATMEAKEQTETRQRRAKKKAAKEKTATPETEGSSKEKLIQ